MGQWSCEILQSWFYRAEFAPWQLKGMNAKAMETGLACCPVWRSSDVEAFRGMSPHRINQTHRCLGVREKRTKERERGKETQEEGEQKRRKVGDRDRTRHRNSQRPLQTQRKR